MSLAVLRRSILLVATLGAGVAVAWGLVDHITTRPAGDYEAGMGSDRLSGGRYDEAMIFFEAALEKQPEHRGALMGRAIVFIQRGDHGRAIGALDHLVATLDGHPGNPGTRGMLAAAYANRGIVHDRLGQHVRALADYERALRTDRQAVAGPGLLHKLLYGSRDLSTVRDRAIYLHRQLQLNEDRRLFRVPVIDARQRMYEP